MADIVIGLFLIVALLTWLYTRWDNARQSRRELDRLERYCGRGSGEGPWDADGR